MNNNKLKIVFIVIFIGFIIPLHSQVKSDNIKVTSEQIIKDNNNISISMNINVDDIIVKRNEMVILTPILKSNEPNGEILSLPPVVITGTLRSKIINRKENLGNRDIFPFDVQPQTILKKESKISQVVNYKTSIVYKTWMDNAALTMQQDVSGCADCYTEIDNQLIVQNILLKLPPASYRLTFITPEVEPVKARSDRHTATFNYKVDRYELLRDYRNNKVQFDEVDLIIGEIRNNQDIEITEFNISGYASPEGNFYHNSILAENRANSFANYLVSKFGISRDKFMVEGKGEDWEGLRKAISNSYLADKENIINIIDNVKNPDTRDIELLKLSNGNTYKTLLDNYYPLLRRTEYTIAYIVRAFDVEEAREIIKKNPKLLSLNEMYLVAQSYPSNSKEFREVFDIAVRLYPENEITIINSAAADIESGNYNTAIDRLRKIENKPIAWNNLGVAYVLKGDKEKALEYFKKAVDNSDDAKTNLDIMK